LPWKAPLVAGNAHDIEGFQGADDPINKEKIIYPDIIMHEDQNLCGIRLIQGGVIDQRQPSAIVEGNPRFQSWVKGKPPQGSAQG
jgi:hypothetical protein